MKNYSLIEAVYTKSDPLDLVDPTIRLHRLADRFWESAYGIHELDDFAMLQCEGDLLLEFSLVNFVKDNLVNVVQAAIGAALEAGISVGTLGAGAPAGVVAEFINDAVFFGISAGDVLVSVKNFFSDLGELKDAVKAMMTIDISNSPQQIYDKVKDVINKLGAFFKKIKIPVEKGIEKLKELYRKLMTKMAKVVGDLVAMFSPIPGTDMIIQNGITEFADDAFKLLMKVYDKMPDFLKEFIQNPAKMKETLMSGLNIVVEFVEKMGSEPKSMFDKLAGAAKDAIMGPVGKLLAGAANSKILNFLKEKAPEAINFVVEAVSKLVPVMWGCGSALAILVNDDHDLFKTEEGGEEGQKEGGDESAETPKEEPKEEPSEEAA